MTDLGDLQTRDDGSYGGGNPCPRCGQTMECLSCGHWWCPECDVDTAGGATGITACLECVLRHNDEEYIP